MFDDELDDEPSGAGQPLPPEDRLWRHPSEVGASIASRRHRERSSRGTARLWLVVVVAGFTGAAVAIGAMVVVAAMPPRVEKETISPVAVTTAVNPATIETVRSIVNATAPGIAEINVVAHGEHRSGSGIIMRTDGALLTSGALVYAADSVNVVLADGRSAAGTVAGSDPTSGLAVVRIPLKGLTVAPIDGASLHPGDRAILVAGPVSAGEQPWVSSGVVSSVNRQVVVGDHTLSDMIETDHPVPPTADGGALVGANGISGVCLAVARADDPTAGYAVPIDVAASVASDLLTYGRARHAWMGVEGDDLSSASSRKLGVAGGAVISAIEPQSPAAAAGLATGDIVVQVGATDVRSMDDLRDVLPAYRPDEEVVLTVFRDGNRMTFTVTLGNKP